MECVATGNPQPSITLLRTQEINGTVEISHELDDRYTMTNGKLTIQNPQEQKDIGIYQCIAHNEFGTILGYQAFLYFGRKCLLNYYTTPKRHKHMQTYTYVDTLPMNLFAIRLTMLNMELRCVFMGRCTRSVLRLCKRCRFCDGSPSLT